MSAQSRQPMLGPEKPSSQSCWQGKIFLASHGGKTGCHARRDPFQPVNELLLPSAWVLDIQWGSQSPGIVYCQDDGVLRHLDLNTAQGPDSHIPRERSQSNWW